MQRNNEEVCVYNVVKTNRERRCQYIRFIHFVRMMDNSILKRLGCVCVLIFPVKMKVLAPYTSTARSPRQYCSAVTENRPTSPNRICQRPAPFPALSTAAGRGRTGVSNMEAEHSALKVWLRADKSKSESVPCIRVSPWAVIGFKD